MCESVGSRESFAFLESRPSFRPACYTTERKKVWGGEGAREARRGVTTQSTERTRISADAKEPLRLLLGPARGRQGASGRFRSRSQGRRLLLSPQTATQCLEERVAARVGKRL